MSSRETLAWIVLGTPALTAAVILARAPAPRDGSRSRRRVRHGRACALTCGAGARGSGRALAGRRIAVDAAGGLLLAVIALIGLASVLVSPAYPGHGATSLFPPARQQRGTSSCCSRSGQCSSACRSRATSAQRWLLIEATTAASALLVGFSGKARALEAGWKYLILTSLGLGVALVGIVMLDAGVPGGGLGGLSWHALPTYAGQPGTALVPTCSCSRGWQPRSGGHRCTTGSRTPTQRLHRQFRPSSPLPSCPRCC